VAKVRVILLSSDEYLDLCRLLNMAAASRSKPTADLGREMLEMITDKSIASDIKEKP